MKRHLFFIGTLALGILGLGAAQSRPGDVTGRWRWAGAAGWQQIEFDFIADGNKLSGTISMGKGFSSGLPVTTGGNPPPVLRMGPERRPFLKGIELEDLWRYYLPTAQFRIENGRIEGDRIQFDQVIYVYDQFVPFSAMQARD